MNLPDRFHAEFRKIEDFNFLDIILGQLCCRATNGT